MASSRVSNARFSSGRPASHVEAVVQIATRVRYRLNRARCPSSGSSRLLTPTSTMPIPKCGPPMSLWPKKKSPTLVWRLSMSSTKKVRFVLPLVMIVAAVVVVAVMAVAAAAPTVVAVAVLMAAAVMSVLVATAAVVMWLSRLSLCRAVAVAVAVAVSYGLAQSASNKELLTAQYRPPG
jgi:hypothetical protein